MNSSNSYSYTTRQSSDNNNSISNNVDAFVAGYIGMIVFGVIFALTIFVIWTWSMISMINLNIRFKYFLEESRQNGNVEGQGASGAKLLRDYKTREQKSAERAEIFAKLRPRRFYMWVAISIPLLLIILFLLSRYL